MKLFGNDLMNILPKGRFAQNVLKIAGGTALGQGIVMLSSPVLTRIYTPEHFGLLSVYVSILSMILVIASMRYEVAITIAQDDAEAAHVVVISLLSVGIISILVMIACLFSSKELLYKLKISNIKSYLYWMLPIGVAGGGAYQVLSNWALRQRNYDCLAKTRFHQGLAQVLTQVGFGFMIHGSFGLLAGADLGRLSGTSTLVRTAWREGHAQFRAISWEKLCFYYLMLLWTSAL